MIIVVMGVAGSGKTTVGELLARQLGWEFVEGDSYHSAPNVEKMRMGKALTETDRADWLERLENTLAKKASSLVLAASLLRRSHRNRIRSVADQVHFVYLKGDYDRISERLELRTDHFFGPNLLASQFEALEEPQTALVFDIAQEPAEIVHAIMETVGQ